MNTATKERPILFSAPMVRAILEGRKKQTRRVVKPQPEFGAGYPRIVRGSWRWRRDGAWDARTSFDCPFGAPGDRLWVRETARCVAKSESPPKNVGRIDIDYRAGGGASREYTLDEPTRWFPDRTTTAEGSLRWQPAIHMPRWASRITLEVKAVRVERLHAISEADAKAEGCESDVDIASRLPHGARLPTRLRHARAEFRDLWDSLNAERAPWSSNPWVWVVEFERIGNDEAPS